MSVTYAQGFGVAVGEAGIRDSGGPDLVLLVADGPATVAATFTTNRFRAAPVLVAEEALAATGGRARAVVINAGCANAGTGTAGIEDARAVVHAVAARVGCAAEDVLPASTGLIGSRLPVAAMERAIADLAPDGAAAEGDAAARAIMTTDTRPKLARADVTLPDGREVRIGGMAKGAGMIHPLMATMLAFVTTDAPVEPPVLRDLLRPIVDRTFNQVTVDGDTSTNDAVFVLAGGAAGGEPLADAGALGPFAAGLEAVCRELATAIAADGEGAEHLIEVRVSGAMDDAEARAVAKTVAGSSLVKTAVHGSDPNWGRIAAAAGRAGASVDADRLRVCIGDVPVYDGAPLEFDEGAAAARLRDATVVLDLDLGIGSGTGVAWGCDLSAEYVAINSEYTT